METRKVRTGSKNEELIRKRRSYMVEKSVGVFLQKGYDKATIRELGKACGMSPSSLYYYIGSKEDILHLMVNIAVQGIDRYKRFRSKIGKVSYSKLLSECITKYFKECDKQSDALLLYSQQMNRFSSEDRRKLFGSSLSLIAFFEELLREGMEAGEFQVRNPTLVAQNIMAYGNNWAVIGWFKQYHTLEQYTKEQIRMILEIVAPRTSQTA